VGSFRTAILDAPVAVGDRRLKIIHHLSTRRLAYHKEDVRDSDKRMADKRTTNTARIDEQRRYSSLGVPTPSQAQQANCREASAADRYPADCTRLPFCAAGVHLLGGEHGMAVLAVVALLDAEEYALRIDVGYLQRGCFRDAQTGAPCSAAAAPSRASPHSRASSSQLCGRSAFHHGVGAHAPRVCPRSKIRAGASSTLLTLQNIPPFPVASFLRTGLIGFGPALRKRRNS